jgi:hypothetical protein
VGFLVDQAALGQVFLRALPYHPNVSFIYHRRWMLYDLGKESVNKNTSNSRSEMCHQFLQNAKFYSLTEQGLFSQEGQLHGVRCCSMQH